MGLTCIPFITDIIIIDVFQVEWSPFVRCMLASSAANSRLHVWDLGNIGKTIPDFHDEDGPPELMVS